MILTFNVGAYGLPKMVLPSIPLRLSHGPHTQKQSDIDRYGRAAIPNVAVLSEMADSIIEVEVDTETKRIVKILLRTPNITPYGDECPDFDRTVVIIPQRGFIKTIWLNKVIDTHWTLDLSKMSRPEVVGVVCI